MYIDAQKLFIQFKMFRPEKITKLRALALRKNETFTEKKLWEMLRNRKCNNLKFRSQFSIHPYIVDFYCHELMLVIELDGISHDDPDQVEYDRKRDVFMTNRGLNVIRIDDAEFIEEPRLLFARIDSLVAGLG